MFYDFFETISDFLATGGDVLKFIFLTSFVLWLFIVERALFFKLRCPVLIKEATEKWNKRTDKKSWYAHRIRELEISQVNTELQQNISYIKTLVALCPLLGLMGTVTGMIAVFDVMALTGTGNARLMASGISMATIPTMAGMVIAISGIYFGSLFQGKAAKAKELIEDEMVMEL